eukprot:CAMPEP_0181347824 /NCGR_PEP_ID=MMETSP1101-20121128/34081_1 /TAXON_ID=46948 /ORGANISM="Rhodomonas abbreviata, Strain Caron Lab Isolate" /LENGTH=449 /DNA_ID=CAMNT_0023460057 /DNA_START=389 /DNA_END=1734 /DNA_ORIENTATION=+
MGAGATKTVIKVAQAVGLEEKKEERRPAMPGEVEKSIAMGRSGLIRNQKKAAINLYRLSRDSDRVRNQIVEEGGLLPLIQMYRSKSSEVQLLSLKTLGELAKTSSNRVKMHENGAIVPLLEGLKHKKYDIRETSVWAIGNIAEYDEARIRLVAEGCTPGLIKFLNEGTKENSLEAELIGLKAAHILSQHSKNHTRMVRDNMLPTLFDVVHSPLKSIKHKSLAMKTLAELSKHESNHKRIKDLGETSGLKRIIKLVGYYDDSVRIYAAATVENLAQNQSLVGELVDQDVLIPLKEMLKSDKHHAVLRSVKAICALAKDSDNQKKIVQENMIPHLLKKAHCGVDEIEEAVTKTLALLAQSNVNRPKILFHGGFKPLIYNMNYGKNEEIKKESKEVVANLFKLPGAKRDELVRKAADKFRVGMGARDGDTFGHGGGGYGGVGGGGHRGKGGV